MNDHRGRQARFNESSRDHWESFGPHRREVARILGAGTPPRPGRLCVLGAGNGHDLDLPALLDVHREVHLVDVDAGALERGVAAQGVASRPRLRLFGEVDLSGMLDVLAGWSPGTTVVDADLAALAESPARLVPPALPGPYELLASTCLLRPLIGGIYHAVGEGHPRFAELVRATRAGHLRLLLRLVAPGGAAVLITDVASSDTVPGLPGVAERDLPGLLRRLDRDQRHFHGVGPADLAAAAARASGSEPEPFPPWRWHLHGRVYLVWALRIRPAGRR